jgi:hypothetical protein
MVWRDGRSASVVAIVGASYTAGTGPGDAWTARKVASLLNAHGVRADRGNSDPLVCDSGISHRAV